MKVSTKYGTESISKYPKTELEIDLDSTTKSECNCERRTSFIILTLTIFCVIGYISYELSSKTKSNSNEVGISNINEVSATFDGQDTSSKYEEGESHHVYDFDLSSMSSHALITHCNDDEDMSYDGDYGTFTYEQDIKAITNGMINNWDEWEEIMRKSTHDDIFIDCFKNQMISGKINCQNSCGWTQSIVYNTDDDVVNFCKDVSLDLVKNEIRPNRRSCILKEIAYQFSEVCDKTGEHSDRISSAAFKWYKPKYDGLKSWKIDDCF